MIPLSVFTQAATDNDGFLPAQDGAVFLLGVLAAIFGYFIFQAIRDGLEAGKLRRLLKEKEILYSHSASLKLELDRHRDQWEQRQTQLTVNIDVGLLVTKLYDTSLKRIWALLTPHEIVQLDLYYDLIKGLNRYKTEAMKIAVSRNQMEEYLKSTAWALEMAVATVNLLSAGFAYRVPLIGHVLRAHKIRKGEWPTVDDFTVGWDYTRGLVQVYRPFDEWKTPKHGVKR